ncbi:MAG TPA: hypothetical protein PKW11_01035, partial [Pseudomonadota bacterium]|nr:hypothetical protein [Pseudomonadota bacterium]
VELKTYPQERGPLKAIVAKLTHKDPDSSEKEGAQVRMQSDALQSALRVVQMAKQLGLVGSQDVLQMPAVELGF